MIGIALLVSAAAAPPQVMKLGCRMDACWWFKEQRRATVLRNRDGELIRYVTLEGSSAHPDDAYPERYSPRLSVEFEPKTSYVFCSRSRPSVAFEFEFEPGHSEWVAHLLDLYDLYGYNMWSAVTYLRACHGVYLNGRRIEPVLRRLGYHSGTPSLQMKLRRPTDLADARFVARAIQEEDAGQQ